MPLPFRLQDALHGVAARASAPDTSRDAEGRGRVEEERRNVKPEDDRPLGRVLVVHQEARTCAAAASLRAAGYEIAAALDAFRGLELVGSFAPDIVLSDLRLPGLDGLAFMDRIHADRPQTRVVLMSGPGSVATAVEAMRRGADHFIEKPVDLEALHRTLSDLMRHAGRRQGAPSPVEDTHRAAELGIVGTHPTLRAAFHRAEQVAPTCATVLLAGESGTGKGLFARAVHRMSERAGGPFVDLSCAALTESLLEAELFGHERGAFTGARRRREGRFMKASGGTLYLDEIADTPLSTQVKLLRVLEERRFERVGGNRTLEVDVRLIAASNRDLESEMAAGGFREDLFYRLKVFRVRLPPLRERISDVPALADAFLNRFAAEHGKSFEGFSRAALDRLLAYRWPGNVRELAHAVEHAVILAREPEVRPQDLPRSISRRQRDPLDVAIPGSTLAEIERAAILETMKAVNGNATEAAAMLGISRSKIYYRLREYER